jgi:hypothetical protein
MQGVGYVMSEEVVECEVTGANLTDTTWTYKPPGIAELPKVRAGWMQGGGRGRGRKERHG